MNKDVQSYFFPEEKNIINIIVPLGEIYENNLLILYTFYYTHKIPSKNFIYSLISDGIFFIKKGTYAELSRETVGKYTINVDISMVKSSIMKYVGTNKDNLSYFIENGIDLDKVINFITT